ncbi:hypothetical protein MJ634_019960, partial [Providencia rettgeri]|uniref:hypothetical protein n=1 Tax=Providencia rettgeri TaxID=587 RepID=UPI001B6CD220|nr:hypothetical protein [Providencia rettgeri]MCB4816442.1 hypothetical protein [Providencia rettgeri]MCJ2225315.1 hypothetical protein [Providencia rettgeri]MCJ2289031.1 hypothetical protein [Providencia rettgeri]MDI7245836.1 hypothetical protein [Providencia rettgeri]
ISSGITARSGRMNITVDYHQTNQKTNTGKTLKPWPILVDHYTRETGFKVGREQGHVLAEKYIP